MFGIPAFVCTPPLSPVVVMNTPMLSVPECPSACDSRRVAHVPPRHSRDRRPFAEEPVPVDHRREEVRVVLAQRARLVQSAQVRREIGDPVGELVRHDVLGRHAGREEEVVAVRVVRRVDAEQRGWSVEPHPDLLVRAVERAPAECRAEVVVGRIRERERSIALGVGSRAWPGAVLIEPLGRAGPPAERAGSVVRHRVDREVGAACWTGSYPRSSRPVSRVDERLVPRQRHAPDEARRRVQAPGRALGFVHRQRRVVIGQRRRHHASSLLERGPLCD